MIVTRKKQEFRFTPVESRYADLETLEEKGGSEIIWQASELLFKELAEPHPKLELIHDICLRHKVIDYPREDGSLPLHVACFNVNCLKNRPIISLLLDFYPKAIQHKNKLGLIPLHKAVSVGGTEELPAIKYLIDQDLSSLTAKTNDGHTPLHLAISRPKVVLSELIDYMISLNGSLLLIADRFGHLPLHTAASRSKVEVELVELLLRFNRHTAGMKDLRGFLPIHWLLMKKEINLEVVFLLAEYHPEGMLEHDHDGCTPYMRYLQNKYKDKEVEEALLELTDLARETVAEKIRNAGKIQTTSSASVASTNPSSRNSHRISSRRSVRR